MDQLIISVGREFGSGGHLIATRLADHYQLPMYDHNLLDEIAASKDLYQEDLCKFDETRHSRLLSRSVRGMSSSPSRNIALLQFDFLREKAAAGESFVIVGHCSETVLKEYRCMVPVFILGDMDHKIERVSKLYQKTPEEAEAFCREKDSKRKKYHNTYCHYHWGDSRNYELSINSSRLGIEGTASLIIDYIDARRREADVS